MLHVSSLHSNPSHHHRIRRLGSVEENRGRKEFSFFLDTFGDEGGSGRELAVSPLCAAGIEGRGGGGSAVLKKPKVSRYWQKGAENERLFFLVVERGEETDLARSARLIWCLHLTIEDTSPLYVGDIGS